MKIFVGRVVGLKSLKTAVVAVERVVIHPLYKKRFKRERKYLVHDEIGVKLGDNVKFVDTRPISKRKKWKITEVVEKQKERKAKK
ncbi:MAG: 30S ribosomal protein S17 [Microgenomates group bacterium]